jgi:hypothetical protein
MASLHDLPCLTTSCGLTLIELRSLPSCSLGVEALAPEGGLDPLEYRGANCPRRDGEEGPGASLYGVGGV